MLFSHPFHDFCARAFKRLAMAALLAASGLVHAGVLNFEGPPLSFDSGTQRIVGDYWVQSHASSGDTGIGAVIDGGNAASCPSGLSCPVGHANNYYAGLKSGYLLFGRQDGSSFQLKSLQASFIGAGQASFPPTSGALLVQGFNAQDQVVGSQTLFLSGPDVSGDFRFASFNFVAPMSTADVAYVQIAGYACDFTGTCSRNPVLANFAIDDLITVEPIRTADLLITKTDGVTSVTAGSNTTYTIVASNAGPDNASGIRVVDALPAMLTGSWTCAGANGASCTASGSGNIDEIVYLPAGASVTYTVSATVSAAASGTLSNTATVTAPAGVTDPAPGNNSATDTDTITLGGDVSVALSGPTGPVAVGSLVNLVLTVHNAGPSQAAMVSLGSVLGAELQDVQWTCRTGGAAVCPAATGSGAPGASLTLPPNATLRYEITAKASRTGMSNVAATVAAPLAFVDSDLDNNRAELGFAVTATAPHPVPGLHHAALMVLGLLAGGLGMFGLRRASKA